MNLWFASRTGQVEQIVSKLQFNNVLRINSGDEIASQEYILLTYTDGFGEVPGIVSKFLAKNHLFLRGVAGSGNRNFGKNFCKSAFTIRDKYKVPLLMTFDLQGSDNDLENFKKILLEFGLT
ncbi:class Ib ribonucleoside-diphosphate reductase assembly flavoprotein NrdI [Candidatus Mycoplasma haematominutum]|uniref:class Ib ribonucleoside-diphosphate reductase assembly flavoprotein NrdI n=1 Tax=Candidatus Mycoplasma haematominutum TaxID=209446 RepID=UPI0005C500D9|nr:class Ib ribonucleoside-diphosphate reductase assembly flavoprotein NrdI [Candidatus Mycoplasma haematominutum]